MLVSYPIISAGAFDAIGGSFLGALRPREDYEELNLLGVLGVLMAGLTLDRAGNTAAGPLRLRYPGCGGTPAGGSAAKAQVYPKRAIDKYHVVCRGTAQVFDVARDVDGSDLLDLGFGVVSQAGVDRG